MKRNCLLIFLLMFLVACTKSTAPLPEELPDIPDSVETPAPDTVETPPADSADNSDMDPVELDSAALIDDFEDSSRELSNAQGGAWYSFSDNGDGGESVLSPHEGEEHISYEAHGYNSKGALAVDFALDKGAYEWEPYVAVATMLDGFDASDFGGLEYYFKGPYHRLRVELSAVKDYDFHFEAVPASADWQKVTIDFAELFQEGWGEEIAFDPALIRAITWEIRGKTGDEGSMFIDNIQFVDSVVCELQNDMFIREPMLPAILDYGDLTVNTAFNEQVIPYLTKGLNFTNWLEEVKFDGTWKFSEKDVRRHALQGFMGLRLPIDLDLYVANRDSVVSGHAEFAVEDELWELLDSFDIWTERHGLSLTIDYHQYDGSFNGTTAVDEGYRAMAANAWKAVAKHFKETTRKDLFFELTNEPDLGAGSNTISAEAWRALAQQMIDSIRTQHPTIPIIYGATDFYSLDKLANEDVLDDEYIVYAFHFYDPFIFTHQGASWSDMGNTRNVPFPYTPEQWSTEYRHFGVNKATPSWIKNEYRNYYGRGNANFIKNRILKIKKWAHEKQVPLICNEWGAYQRTVSNESLNNYNRTMGEIFTELDIAWQVWFGVFDEEGNLLPGLGESLGLAPR
ncbi:MAG: cellulase family glycosylhydrolase [Fibrobacter sp.]|nr:cellulase family glycosylhydrolase [Fibrobacter sp.]